MKGRANRQKTIAEQVKFNLTHRKIEGQALRRDKPAREKAAWERAKKR